MSEPENFLSRWARLKREALEEGEAPDAATPETAATAAKESRADAPATDATDTPAPEPAFDISKLPPIESITATTDIRAFLEAGVPPDLARAALRRAWVADPAIRNFVGIAENQWDFNDPNAIPGFGSLGPLDDVRRMVAQVFGGSLGQSEDVAAAEESSALAAPPADSIAAEVQESAATEGDLPRPERAQQSSTLAPAESGGEPSIAVQQDDTREQSTASAEVPPRRQHGGALPQ